MNDHDELTNAADILRKTLDQMTKSAKNDQKRLEELKESLVKREPDAQYEALDAFEIGYRKLVESRKNFAVPPGGDSLEKAQNISSLTSVAEPQKTMPEKEEVFSLSENIQENPPPISILSKFESLCNLLQIETSPLSTWTDMDWASSKIKSSLSSLLTQTKNPQDIVGVVKSLHHLSELIENQSSAWGVHSSSWQEWAIKTKKDLKLLLMWVAPETPSQPKIHSKDQVLPIDPSPEGTPPDFVDQIIAIHHQLEILKKQGSFVWSDTPLQKDFFKSWQKLAKWAPTGIEQKEWKEKALDFYIKTNARAILSSCPLPPEHSATASPRKIKNK